jgi:hypothetical protein
MSRWTGAGVALVSVLLAWTVSGLLTGQPLWLRMLAALLTAVAVIVAAPFLLGRHEQR